MPPLPPLVEGDSGTIVVGRANAEVDDGDGREVCVDVELIEVERLALCFVRWDLLTMMCCTLVLNYTIDIVGPVMGDGGKLWAIFHLECHRRQP